MCSTSGGTISSDPSTRFVVPGRADSTMARAPSRSRSRFSRVQAPSKGVCGMAPRVTVSVAAPSGASDGSTAETRRSITGGRSGTAARRQARVASSSTAASGATWMGPRKAQASMPAGSSGGASSATSRRAVAGAGRKAPTRSTSAGGSSLQVNRERKVRLRSSVEMTARAATSLPSASPTPATRRPLRLMSAASRPQVISAPASSAAARSASPNCPSPPAAMPPGDPASS